MTRRLAIGAALLIALWVLLFLRFGADRTPGPPRDTHAAASPRSDDAVARPRPSAPVAAAPPPAAPSPAATTPAAPDPPDPPPPRDWQPPNPLGRIAVFKRAYAEAPRDAQAAAAEARIRTLFGTEQVPRELLISANCRKTICRIRVLWNKQRGLGYAKFLMAAGVLISEAAVEPQGTPDRAGNLEVDVYIRR